MTKRSLTTVLPSSADCAAELALKLGTPQASPAPDAADAQAAVEQPASEACFDEEEDSVQFPDPVPAVIEAPGSTTADPLEGVKLEHGPLRPPLESVAEGDAQGAPEPMRTGAAPGAGGLLSPLMQAAADAPMGSQEEDSLNVTLNVQIPPQLDPDQLFEFYKSILESQGVGPSQQLLGFPEVKPLPGPPVSEDARGVQGGEGDNALALLAESVGPEDLSAEGDRGQVASQNAARVQPSADHAKPSPETMLLLDTLPTQLLGISHALPWSTDNVTAADPQDAGAEQSVMASILPSEADPDPEAFLSLIKEKDDNAGVCTPLL